MPNPRLPSSFAVAAVLLLVYGCTPAGDQSSSASAVGDRALTYRLDAASSSVKVFTGSSGALGFLGHDHVIAVPSFTGEARIDTTDLKQFALTIEVPADSLRVIEEKDAGDRRKIENDMRQDVLESPAFPTIGLRGVGFRPGGADSGQATPWGMHKGRLQIELNLHGVSRTLEVPLQLELDPNQLRARGKFAITHADFNLPRKKVAGVVNVAEELEIEYDVRGGAVRGKPSP